MKAANVPEERRGEPGAGVVWTFVALGPDSNVAVPWLAGNRGAGTATELLIDVQRRLANRVPLTSDGRGVHLKAIANAFGIDVDSARLVKHYGSGPEGERRYSPTTCLGTEKSRKVVGCPHPSKISTSAVERRTSRCECRSGASPA